MKKAVILALVVAGLGFACTNWEQNTYASLSSAKQTINCASAEYDHNDAAITQYCAGVTTPSAVYLPQSTQVHNIIATAASAKDVAVNAMITYEAAKAAKTSTNTAQLQSNVDTAVAALSADIAQLATGGK